MPEYKKLVRDKVPEIIEGNGEVPVTRILHDEEEYTAALIAKTGEESQELANATTLEERVEELADLEKLVQILKQRFGADKVDAASMKKEKERGGFEKRIFLEHTE